MDWRLKGLVQKALGVAPRGEQLHYWLQKKAGGLRGFERECDIKVDDFGLMVGHLRSVGWEVAGARLLEIGSGWYPTFPVCLHLLGATRVETFDLTRHMRPELVAAMVGRLRRHLATLAALGQVALAEVERRHRVLAASIADGATIEAASRGGIVYHAPADAARTGLAPGAVDVVFSNSVLEHVPGPVIAAIFEEAHRVLSPRGVMFHSVNCGDHYAYVDRSIDQLHYLQYSEARWRFWNNAFLYQNRLRAEDFTRAARAARFTIEVDTSRPHPDRLRQLDAITVDRHFARYSRDQLAITSIDFVARPER
ncbi:MAG: methyltransferase domain-containing protein [Kofleriaceae bacterium]|jgi:SAM-dependent methyltransferase|nr:methyltransferase domain-containing protein [Kofleriaceae bacterium]